MGVAYVHTLWVRLVLLCFSHSTHHVPYDLKLSIETFEAAELLNALGDISLTFLFRMIFFFSSNVLKVWSQVFLELLPQESLIFFAFFLET